MDQNGPLPRQEPGYTQIDMAQRIAGFHGAMATNCHTGNWTRLALTEDLGCFYDWEGRWGPDCAGLPWQPGKLAVDDPAKITEIDTALFLGASLVGITRINPQWNFKPGWNRYGHHEIDLDAKLPPGIQYAVVMAIETRRLGHVLVVIHQRSGDIFKISFDIGDFHMPYREPDIRMDRVQLKGVRSKRQRHHQPEHHAYTQ